MQRETQAAANGERFWQTSATYHGVIAKTQSARLIVSPNGSRYCIQHPVDAGGQWAVVKWRKVLSLLVSDMPPELAARLPADTPENASDWPRPWAGQIEAKKRQVSAANWCASEYAGTIAADGAQRLIWFRSKGRPERYGVQRHQWGKWTLITASASCAFVASVLRSNDPKKRNTALAAVCDGLPDQAADYAGIRPETLAAVLVQPAADRQAAKRAPQRDKRSPVGKGSQNWHSAPSGASDGLPIAFEDMFEGAQAKRRAT